MNINMHVNKSGVDHSIEISNLTSTEFDAIRIVLLTVFQHSKTLASFPTDKLSLGEVIAQLSQP